MKQRWILPWGAILCFLGLQARGAVTFELLYAVSGSNGTWPVGIAETTNGDFYGTAVAGGIGAGVGQGGGYGTLFKLATNGTLSTMFIFGNTNGAHPVGIMAGRDENFYGATDLGGKPNAAVAYCDPCSSFGTGGKQRTQK